MFWRPGVDQQGDQFAGAVPGEYEVRRDPAVCGQDTAQRSIIPVRVGRKNIQVRCNLFLYGIRQPQRVDICPEVGDVFFIQMIVSTDFLNVAPVKNRSCIHVLPSLRIKTQYKTQCKSIKHSVKIQIGKST